MEAVGWLLVACVLVAIVESIVQTLDEKRDDDDNDQ